MRASLYFFIFSQDQLETTNTVYGHKLEAYRVAAQIVKVHTDTIREWVREFEMDKFIIDSRRGKHSKTSSPILEDLEFREQFRSHVRETARIQGSLFLSKGRFQKLKIIIPKFTMFKF